jgi:ATP adenylyltransferase
VFCRILGSGLPDEETFVLWRGAHTFAILNAYPYTSGHLMVLPLRHVGELDELTDDEGDELFRAARIATAAVKAAYEPGGFNLGANLGRAGGAGVPGHLHVHVLPRWAGDTNFMTAVADTRVLPESLGTTWKKLKEAWPA